VQIGSVGGIPIYGFNSAETDTYGRTTIERINAAYNDSAMNPYRDKLSTDIKKIYIVEGSDLALYTFDPSTGVLQVASGGTIGTYIDCFKHFVLLIQERTSGTDKALSFGTNCKVTIKGVAGETYTNDEWNALCDKVVAAINARYATGGQVNFKSVFASDWGANVILGSAFTHNWEVKDGEFKNAYVKIASIDTIDFDQVVMRMKEGIAGFASLTLSFIKIA